MNAESAAVFFYGLFMDESLLASRGFRPSNSVIGYVDGYALRIGKRATLVPDEAARAHGVFMTMPDAELRALYSDDSVSDYVAETVSVVLKGGAIESALCYILPAGMLEGTNAEYASSLLALAKELGFPDDYLQQIKERVA